MFYNYENLVAGNLVYVTIRKYFLLNKLYWIEYRIMNKYPVIFTQRAELFSRIFLRY